MIKPFVALSMGSDAGFLATQSAVDALKVIAENSGPADQAERLISSW